MSMRSCNNCPSCITREEYYRKGGKSAVPMNFLFYCLFRGVGLTVEMKEKGYCWTDEKEVKKKV